MARMHVMMFVLVLSLFPMAAEAPVEPRNGGTLYFDEASFLAAAGVVAFEGFEAFPTGQDCATGGSTPVTGIATTSFTVTTMPTDPPVWGGGRSFLCIGTTGIAGHQPTEGQNALVAGTLTGTRWTLIFSPRGKRKVYAFGLYINTRLRPTYQGELEHGDMYLSFSAVEGGIDSDGNNRWIGIGNTLVCCATTVEPMFVGFISETPFKSIALKNNGFDCGADCLLWSMDEVMLGYRKPR